MIIRKIQQTDVPYIYDLLYEEWGTNVADRIIAEVNGAFEVGTFKPQYYVAIDNHNIVCGFAGFAPSHILHGVYELNGIVVSKDLRGCNVGRDLTEKRIEEIVKLGGTYIMLMTKQREFFDKFEFVPVSWHGDWVLMTRELAAPKFE